MAPTDAPSLEEELVALMERYKLGTDDVIRGLTLKDDSKGAKISRGKYLTTKAIPTIESWAQVSKRFGNALDRLARRRVKAKLKKDLRVRTFLCSN